MDDHAFVKDNGPLAGKHEQVRHTADKRGEAVVVLHGLLMPAAAMSVLARRVRRAGWTTHIFSYASRHAATRANAAALAVFLRNLDAERIHFVAHSLGGLVVIQLLRDFSGQRPGRVVLLGTPYLGSHVARRISRHLWGRWLCGMGLNAALLGDGPRWPGGRELGVIAGTKPFGAGWVAPGLPKPNDGTVAAAETVVAGATDSITVPVTHAGLVYSAKVARQVVQFLSTGRFSRQVS